jgi:serine/threonine protein kinase
MHLHSLGLVHGDLTPENIVQTSEGGYKLSFYGEQFRTSRRPNGALSDHQSVRSASRYMAPELAAEPWRKMTAESDIWSFGVLVLELALGVNPWYNTPAWEDNTEAKFLLELASDPYLTPPITVKDPVLASFLDLCLNRDPSLRSRPEQLLSTAYLI